MSFERDWEVQWVECAGDGCTPEHPTCDPCIKGKAMFGVHQAVRRGTTLWHELEEWKRASWRTEASD